MLFFSPTSCKGGRHEQVEDSKKKCVYKTSMNIAIILPGTPGLERRQAYGEYVRIRNARLRNGAHRHHVRLEGDYRHNVRLEGNYETLSQLPVVAVGLQLKDLVVGSSVSVCFNTILCVICQHDIAANTQVQRWLRCGHSFHAPCIEKWFVEHSACPLCKTDMKVVK